MKSIKSFFFVMPMAMCFLATSCTRNVDEVWEDTKSCGRHFVKGVGALKGKREGSRQIRCKDEFLQWQSDMPCEEYQESEFVSIPGEQRCNDVAMADFVAPQPSESPGDPGSSIPGISAFSDPATISHLSSIFSNIHFEYNNNLVKGRENCEIVHRIANYMKSQKNTYIFIEGHCDERGPEAYNLALGTRRSNAVRAMLIQEGVNPDNIFTISYGAERPLVLDSNEEAWSKNRRAEFKVYRR